MQQKHHENTASVPKDFVSIEGFTPKVESDLSLLTAEYQPKSACSTQNKAKRANKIVFLLLIRDQEVGGSNPLELKTQRGLALLRFS